jgi:phage terminase large subunit GpA-like protein
LGFIIPICYHLFEIQETVVCGVPSMDTVSDKWNEDILPVIEKTRYRYLLPLRGGGSKGGRVMAVRFRNGATLRFMTGGGSDKARASFTSRVLVVTETDDFARSTETSLEADKLKQLEGRTRAYKDRSIIYQECTVTTAENPTWNYYETGSASRILTPCPHCHAYVCMEREQLIGWQEADTEEDARASAKWSCPACGEEITEDERVESNRKSKLVHKGQEITDDGQIVGPMPPTRTLGFRWSGFHNLFTDAAELATEEWKKRTAADEENAEKALRQFIWCLPYVPQLVDTTRIDPKEVVKRKESFRLGEIPADTMFMTIGVDIGKWTSWFLCLCFRQNRRIHIPDYGVIEVHSDEMQEQVAVLMALREFREQVNAGWQIQGTGNRKNPDAVWIDSNYWPAVVHQFCKESGTWPMPNAIWYSTIGRGQSQMNKMKYLAPKRTSNEIRKIGDGWFLAKSTEHKSCTITVDADKWKLWLQAGLRIPMDMPGAITLFDPGSDKMQKDRHNKLSRHFASEQFKQEQVEGKGLVASWEKHGANHFLDCGMNACAAGSYLGFRLTEVNQVTVAQAIQPQQSGGWMSQQKRV